MKVSVLYFARLRERLGAGESLELDPGSPGQPRTVGELRNWLAARSPSHAEALSLGQAVRAAFNQVMCGPDQLLAEGAEVAFFPPVTGG